MLLNNITLVNFRNYEKVSIDFSNNINILIGDNAQGKTNILESIYVLAITKSHRSLNDINLIKNNKEFCKLKGKIRVNGISRNLEFFLSNKEKRVSINNKQIRRLTDYISNFNIILFTPDDLELIKGSPSVRRKFLNIEIGQLDNHYLNILNDYNKLLKTRNEYLKINIKKNKLNINYLNALTDKIIEKALYIYQKRFEFINQLNKYVNNIYYDITKNGNLQLKYINNLSIDNYDSEKIKKILYEKFNQNLEKEKILGVTLFGPHKDDIIFKLDDNDIKIYGSQGQQRSCILALKLSEISIFKEITKENPIVLLDDVFSELDDIKKNNLIKYFNDDIQIVITTTDLKEIKKELLNNSCIYKVENGTIEKLEEV